MADLIPDEATIERLARASWDAADGFITGIPWPPRSALRVRKEKRRVRAVLAAYLGQSFYIDQEIEWNPAGEWKSGFVVDLSGEIALIVLHETGQRLNVDTRHLRPRAAELRSTTEGDTTHG